MEQRIKISNGVKKFAVNLALKSGKYLLSEFKRDRLPRTRYKQGREMVTEADISSERLILRAIQQKYPRHQILSEEIGLIGPPSDYLWLVDPLDGTVNFSMKNPLFGLSLGLAYKKQLILGVMCAPYISELYVAERGQGAFLNGKRIKVSQKSKLADSTIVYCPKRSGGHPEAVSKIVKIFGDRAYVLRQIGSAIVELGWLAVGRYEGLLASATTPWDAGAGALIVREAGGLVSDWQGKDWQIEDKTLLVSNKFIHSQILKILKEI